MTTSSMFLADTTNIDFAYIDENGQVIGGSFRPKFHVTGEIDEVENVVIDFSSVKKVLKAAIDDKTTGFDHKLWWIEGTSKGDITFENDRVKIVTPMVEVEGPSDIVRVVNEPDVAGIIKKYLESTLSTTHSGTNAVLDVFLTSAMDSMPTINTSLVPFRYVHGLKDSTSWGCQNIAHGHLSYIAARSDYPDSTNLVLTQIAAALDNSIFAKAENVVNDDDNGVVIEYTSSRGDMRMVVRQPGIVRLETETTIEHIVTMIAEQWGDDLRNVGTTLLYVSEGLSKGAVISL